MTELTPEEFERLLNTPVFGVKSPFGVEELLGLKPRKYYKKECLEPKEQLTKE